MNDLTTKEATFDLVPQTLQEAISFSEMIAKSSMIPKDYHGKPGDILIAIQYGHELGIKPLQALQSIACINGRPCVFGDALLGVVQASSVYEWHDESESSETAGVCVVKRLGVPPIRSVFTLDDAKRAGLLGKPGPWQQYTSRMLKMRARGFALRDAFSDVLKGLIVIEEAIDIESTTVVPEKKDQEPSLLTLKDKLKAQVVNEAITPEKEKEPPLVQPTQTERPDNIKGDPDAYMEALKDFEAITTKEAAKAWRVKVGQSTKLSADQKNDLCDRFQVNWGKPK